MIGSSAAVAVAHVAPVPVTGLAHLYAAVHAVACGVCGYDDALSEQLRAHPSSRALLL